MIKAQTFTWVVVPKGKRIKKVLPLDERLSPYLLPFEKRFGVAPKIIFMRTEMAEDWESDTVLGLTIHRLDKNYPIHNYTFAVTEKDFLDEKHKRVDNRDQEST